MDQVLAMLQLDSIYHLGKHVRWIILSIHFLHLYVAFLKNFTNKVVPHINVFGPSMERVVLCQMYGTHTVTHHPQLLLLHTKII